MNITQLFIFVWMLFFNFYAGAMNSFDKKFLESFIVNYEFSPEGRYVHEYHPFVLDLTRRSFDQLEQRLSDDGFDLCGRYGILGYEENAVPSYFTDFSYSKINDEATLKNRAGWSMKLHNRFGFMTGFLFKDLDKLPYKGTQIFHHINADLIPIFDDRATIFQEHAFGQALDMMNHATCAIIENVVKRQPKEVCKTLIKFWKKLYSGAHKVGNKQVAGTQDIFFSIEAAQHLINSNLPIFKYFVGPDITYPIETFTKQSESATRNAQSFVQLFARQLEPIEEQKTVYVFCSFVDGVGKSTMLGNIKNWMNFGDCVEKYRHVDNSSSQLAEVFEFKENVYIADLPAQISHFTYKPDGWVFVDIQTAFSKQQIKLLQEHIRTHKEQFEQEYERDLLFVRDVMDACGSLDERIYSIEHPDKTFLKNLILLKKDQGNRWIPFCHEGTYFLYNRYTPEEIRFLTPLADVKSEGLKNIESEQMLFFKGIRFPLPYISFLDDLVEKLKNEGIKKVVFADFLSMYPRSSRENIRINYILQQMALLNSSFDVKKSIYRDFVSGSELLFYLKDRQAGQGITDALRLESIVRLILCRLITNREEGDLTGIELRQLTERLRDGIRSSSPELISYIDEQVNAKIGRESEELEKTFGRSKSFINMQYFSFYRAARFSRILQELFCSNIKNERLQELWEDPGRPLETAAEKDDGYVDAQIVETDAGKKIRLCYKFNPECRDEGTMLHFLRSVRACWYAAICNILDATTADGSEFVLQKERFFVPSLFLNQYNSEMFHLILKYMEDWEGERPAKFLLQNDYTLFNSNKGGAIFGTFMDCPYRLDWNARSTQSKVYAFDCSLDTEEKRGDAHISIVTRLMKKFQNEHGTSMVMPTSELYKSLKESAYFKKEQEEFLKEAKKNGYCPYVEKKGIDNEAEGCLSKKEQKKLFAVHPQQIPALRLVVRLLVTLDMIIKDVDSDIVVRYGNRKDFKAALKLFEKITLPKYFNRVVPGDLFSDYSSVEPFPEWSFWDETT